MNSLIALVYFIYGLAFFSMGFGILLELGHGTDERLRHSLRPLSAFGILHGIHEWLEMFANLGVLSGEPTTRLAWEALRLAILAFSFLSLGAFGSSLLAETERSRRVSLLLPLCLAAVWGVGLFILRGVYPLADMVDVADVWTRYVLAVPSALFACAGLVVQQRRFRQAGMAQFGRMRCGRPSRFSGMASSGRPSRAPARSRPRRSSTRASSRRCSVFRWS